MMRRYFLRNASELQFWGYELGNVVAALAAVGGAFSLAHIHVDFVLPVLLGALVLLVALGQKLLEKLGMGHREPWLNGIAAAMGIALLAAAALSAQNWLTTAAIAFLTGSALIRLTQSDAAFMKLGALFLILGGLALSAFGLEGLGDDEAALAGLTLLTGAYVAGASVLTYVGGIFIEREQQGRAQRAEASVLSRAMRPLDRFVFALSDALVTPAIFWVSAETKATRPFMTSMAARLPFRMATGTVALSTGTVEGFLFAAANALWALGDIAIGAFDWARISPSAAPSGASEAPSL